MKFGEWLRKWSMTSLKVKTPYLDMEFKPQEADKKAAWDLYIELLTRVATQELDDRCGDEVTALESVYSIFSLTRNIIKENGRECNEFAKVAIVILNQKIRPFTSKWHKPVMDGELDFKDMRKEFRADLRGLQKDLRLYTGMLADIAGVEDLTDLEQTNAKE